MTSRSRNVAEALRSRQRGFLLNPYRFGAGGGPTDPYFANVSLSSHFDGTDASTTFVDSGPSPKTLTAHNGASIRTAQYVFGGASALFDGVDDYVDTPDSSDFTLGTGNFTIEFWVRLTAAPLATRTFVGQLGSSGANTTGSFGIQIATTNFVTAFCFSGSSTIGSITANTLGLAANVWYHIAYTRNGSTFTLWIGGVSRGTATSASAVNDSSANLAIGRFGDLNAQYANAYIDDLRITKGVARYTGTFTPSGPNPDS